MLACFARVLWRDLLAAGERGEAQVELVVLHWSGGAGQEEDQIVADVLERYEAAHPGVRVRRINPGDAASFYTKLQTMLAAGEPPDVFYVGAERVASFASLGLMAPVDEFVERDLARAQRPADAVVLEDYYPAVVDAFRYDGQRVGAGALYGVPKDFTTVGFYYNKALFARAGLEEPADDWTWDDFAAAARAIGALPDCTGAEFVTWPPMLRAYLWTEGVDVLADDLETLRFDDPVLRATLARLRDWRHGEEGTLTSGKSQTASGETVFFTGQVGLAGPFGRWVVPSYRTITDFEWDFAPMPRGREQANMAATVAWAMSSRTEHPEEAWALVRSLVSERTQTQLSELGLAIPTLRRVAESEAFLDPDAPPSRDRSFLDAAEVARVVPWPANPKFESLLGSRLDQALRSGDLELDEAIEAFEAAWTVEGASPLAKGGYPPMPWGRLLRWIAAGCALLGLVAVLALRRRRPGRLARAEERAGFALTSPLTLGLLLFAAFPIGLSLLLSFARWQGVATLDQAQWVGWANYEQLLLHDTRLRTSLRVTAYYALLAVPLGQGFALMAALLMNARVPFIGFFRAAWYLPSVLAGVGVAVLWRWVFDHDAGLLKSAAEPLGLHMPEWFGADAELFGAPAFALMNLWMVGGSMMVYLAGLKGIPRDLYEAAELDGSSAWERFRHVTLPMLSPIVLFNGVMAVIASFQVFTQAFVMTKGEPGDLTRFYVLYVYNQAFEFYEMGYASAMAWLLLVIVLALTAVVMRLSKRSVHYEALES